MVMQNPSMPPPDAARRKSTFGKRMSLAPAQVAGQIPVNTVVSVPQRRPNPDHILRPVAIAEVVEKDEDPDRRRGGSHSRRSVLARPAVRRLRTADRGLRIIHHPPHLHI